MPKRPHFGLREKSDREREREEKKGNLSSLISRGFCQSELDTPGVKAALRDESYSWVLESQDFAKVQGSGFHENREKYGVLGKSR